GVVSILRRGAAVFVRPGCLPASGSNGQEVVVLDDIVCKRGVPYTPPLARFDNINRRSLLQRWMKRRGQRRRCDRLVQIDFEGWNQRERSESRRRRNGVF